MFSSLAPSSRMPTAFVATAVGSSATITFWAIEPAPVRVRPWAPEPLTSIRRLRMVTFVAVAYGAAAPPFSKVALAPAPLLEPWTVKGETVPSKT